MPTATLTVKRLDHLPPPATGRLELWDAGPGAVPGLLVRVTPSGVRSWSVVYRHAGRQRRVTLGTYPRLGLAAARTQARTVLGDAAKGLDPARAKRAARAAAAADAAALTVGAAVARYLAESVEPRALRTAPECRRIFEQYLVPRWGARPLAAITRADVTALLRAMQATPIQANRAVEKARACFRWCLKAGLLVTNPAADADRYAEPTRDRVLTDAEVAALWPACDRAGARLAPAFRLLLLTGQRAGEVIGMRWAELDAARAWWTLPGARTKNRRTHRVPLGPAARACLAPIAPGASPWVFANRTGTGPITAYHAPWVRAVTAAEIDGVTVHDLRRTVVSGLARLGVPRVLVKQVVNHVGHADVTDRYDHYRYDAEKRDALERWAAHVQAVVAAATPATGDPGRAA